MNDIFSLVTFTAAAFCFATFLTTLDTDLGRQEFGLNPHSTVARHISGHDKACHLRGELLAARHDGRSVLSRLHHV